eukprot:930165-Prymnesium_polylepis.1
MAVSGWAVLVWGLSHVDFHCTISTLSKLGAAHPATWWPQHTPPARRCPARRPLECASRAYRATMPTTTCCQRPTPTPSRANGPVVLSLNNSLRPRRRAWP